MKKHYRHENNCLNCDTILEGKFCHNCGQENLEIKESFGHMMNHAISDYFHFDHQFFHTLKPLLFKPGFLTNEYMAGRRVQYLHPVKMYIFISIVYFLLLFQSGNQMVKVSHQPNGKAGVKTSSKSVDSVNKRINNNNNLSAYQKKEIQQAVKKYGVVDLKKPNDKLFKSDDDGFLMATSDTTYEQYLSDQQKLTEDKRDGFLERMFAKKSITYKQKYGSRAKEVFIEEFNHNIPKMMFLMLPIFALILRIAFWKNKKFYVEHLIYTFHLHCFLFVFLAFIMLVQLLIPGGWKIIGLMDFAATVYITWYIYKSLRVVYQRSRFRTITKIIGMTLMYFSAFVFCVCIVIFFTAALMA